MKPEFFTDNDRFATVHKRFCPISYDYNDVLCPRDEIRLYREISDIEETEHFYSDLGKILLKAPTFHSGALKLCCAVPVKHFLPENAPGLVEYLDLVILREQDVVMAAKVARPDIGLPSFDQLLRDFKKALLLPALPLFILDSKDFIDLNGSEPVIDLVMLAGQIETLLIQQFPSSRPCIKMPLQQIPAELFSSLMLSRFRVLSSGDKQNWSPTEFGRSLGILQAFQTDKDNHPRSLLCCAEENLSALQEVVSWGEKLIFPQAQEPQKKIPLFRRICQARQEIPDNNAAAALLDMTQNFARTPLSEYLQDEPERLKSFQARFKAATFQEAARCFEQYDELMKGFDWFLDILVRPLLQKSDIPLADKPLRSVIWASSILAKSKYLAWRGESLLHDHDIFHCMKNWSYREWLQWLIEARDETDNIPVINSINSEIRFLIAELFSLVCAADPTAAS